MQNVINVKTLLEATDATDLSARLQAIIDEHPNKTLFFPDGDYPISKPILTPADPKKSVSLKLSDFAVIHPTEHWTAKDALIRLGGKDPANNIETPGSNYGLEGGILECRGIANGISIDNGRETYVRNTSIKNAVIGLHIRYGTNNGSSDADIFNVNITGNESKESIGLLVNGSDNTFTNMRIGHVFVGVEVSSGGNIFRNVHPLYYVSSPTYPDYEECVGFRITSKSRHNWFDYCYSDHFATGFQTLHGVGNFVNCFCFWYSEQEKKHIAFESKVPFSGRINGLEIGGKAHPESGLRFANDLILTETAIVEGIYIKETLWKENKLDV